MPDPQHLHPVAPWPPAFSTTYVEQARALLDQRPVLVIVGATGGSRGRLAAEIADTGTADGPLWSHHNSRFGEQDEPFVALRQILHSLPDDLGTSLAEAEAAARQALDGRAERRPTIIISSADLCDAGSLDVLVRLAISGDIRLIATLTPETVDEHPALIAAAERLDIPPLDLETISALLQVRYGHEAHHTVVEFLRERSQGTYGVLQEIADIAVDTGAVALVEDVLVAVPTQSQAVFAQLEQRLEPRSAGRLGDGQDLIDLLDLVAVLGQVDVKEARDCVDPETVDNATDHGALKVVDGGLVFASKAEAVLVSRTMPRDRLVALFHAYADRLPASSSRRGTAVHAADWWLAAGRPLPVELAARAAREANLSGRYRRALAFTDAAHNEEHVAVAPIERGFALVELGGDRALRSMFTTIDPSTLTEEELLPYLRWTTHLESDEQRADLQQRAVESDDPETTRRRQSVRVLAELLERVFDEGGDHLLSRIRSLVFSANLSPCNRAMTFTALAAVQRHSGRPELAVESAEHALTILRNVPDGVSAFHLDVVQEMHILALITALELDRADEAIRDYSSGVFDLAGSGRMTTALRGMLELTRGNVQQALANARLCLADLDQHDPHQIRGWVEALLAQVLVQCHRPDEARDYLDLAGQHVARRRQHDLERRIAQACAHDALAEPEEALALLSEVTSEARSRGLRLAEIDAAVLSVQIGGPMYLPELLDAVRDLTEPSGTPAVWQEFAHAADRYDIPALRHLAEQLEGRSAHLLAAEVAQYVLDMARRASDLTDDTRARLARLADPMSHRRPQPPVAVDRTSGWTRRDDPE